jgi:hypothetical protein
MYADERQKSATAIYQAASLARRIARAPRNPLERREQKAKSGSQHLSHVARPIFLLGAIRNSNATLASNLLITLQSERELRA